MKQPGKRTQYFGGLETSFATPPSIAATHALRVMNVKLDGDPLNRVFSGEKKAAPGRYAMFDRRETAGFSVEGLIRPSGTLNTLPECSFVLEGAFGVKHNSALGTPVASGGWVRGATLAATPAGLAAKTSGVQILCPDGKLRLRRVTTLPGGNAITWAPDLPAGQTPAVGATVKAINCYYLTSANAKSIWLAAYTFQADFTSGLGELLKGGMVDRLSLAFDWQDEPRFSASGPGKTRTAAAAHPGAFTQVGTNPPSALTSECLIGANPMKYMKVGVEITNGLEVRNDEINATAATEGYRMGDRDISVGFDVLHENGDKTYLYDLAIAGTNASLFKQTGFTSGKMIALFAPNVYWKAPTVDVGDGPVSLPMKGMALEAVEDANDELVLMLG